MYREALVNSDRWIRPRFSVGEAVQSESRPSRALVGTAGLSLHYETDHTSPWPSLMAVPSPLEVQLPASRAHQGAGAPRTVLSPKTWRFWFHSVTHIPQVCAEVEGLQTEELVC